jgi:hypothetical protein
MSKIKILGKLNPKQYSEMIDHLTRKKIKNPFIKAKDIVVDKKPEVEQTEMFNRFNKANPRQDMAGGGMLVQPSADGSRPGYATSKVKKGKFIYPITNQSGTVYSDKKPKSSARKVGSGKFSMADRNRVTRIKYPEYSSYAELLKKEPAKAKNVMASLQYSSVSGSKITKKTFLTPLTEIQQNKILAEFPDADFSKGKLGFHTRRDQTKYVQVQRFIARGYKPKFKTLPLKLQNDIKEKFSEVKNWDFKKYKYGVPQTLKASENRKIAMRIKNFVADPKPYKLGFSTQAKGGWMVQQMYRAWEHGNTDYEPIYNKNDKVIGMKEKGKTYYANENVAPSKKFKLINSHPEFDKVQKFVDVANEAKLPLKDLSGYKNTKALIALFPEGFESVKFSDLVNYLYKEQGADVTRNAIEKHHLKNLSDMGAPVESKNLQLLRQDLNTLGNTITQQIKEGDLSRVGDLEKAGVKITVDGKTYGKGFQDPRRQLNRIIGDVTQKISSLDEKQFKNIVATLGGGNCGRIKKYQGGRIGLQDGTPNVDVCYDKATNRINSGFKNATPAEARNYTKLLNAVKGSAVIGRNLLKFGIIPEALYVGADSLIRVGFGDTFKEAGLRAADFFIPGDQMQEADKLKVQRTLGDAAATNVGRVFDYRNQIANIDSLEKQKANLENLSDVGEFDYIGDLSQDVKNIDTRLNQAKNDLQNKFMVSEAETVAADQALEEAYDISKAKSPLARLKRFTQNIEAVQDDPFLSDIATPQKTQMDLNLNMFPTAIPTQTDFMKLTDTDIMNRRRDLINAGVTNLPSSRDLMSIRDAEIADREKRINEFKAMPLMDAANQFGREQVFGTQGTFFGEPIIKTQPRVRNTSQDIDPFQAAGGGIAKLAGDRSGRPPERGPNSQGLLSLMKRGMKI